MRNRLSLFALLPIFACVLGVTALAQQQILPEKVTMLVDANFPVPAAVNEAVQPVSAGTEVSVKAVLGDKVRVAHGLGESIVAIADTDFADRVARLQATIAAAPASAPQSEQTSAPLPPRTEDPYAGIARVSAQNLSSAYAANELAADQQFRGKTIIVTGRIHSIAEDPSGEPYVVLDTDRAFSMTPVRCFFSRDQISSLTNLASGQTVSIKGEVAGKGLFLVAVRDCQVIGRR